MPFEGLSSSPSQNRAPTERRRVPRAKILSDQEKRIIHDARQELKSRQDPEYRRELAEMEQYRGFSATKNRATETGSKLDFDALDRAYQIQDGPGMRRIARENRADVGNALRDTARAHEDFMKEQDVLNAQFTQAQLNERDFDRINDEMNAYLGASRKNAPSTSSSARSGRPDLAPFGFRSADELGSDDLLDLPKTVNRAPFGFRPADELGSDDLLDLPKTVDRAPFGFRSKNELGADDVLDLPTRAADHSDRRQHIDTALNRLNAEINRLDRGDFRHEQESIVLAPELQQDVRAMNIADLEVRKAEMLATLSYARAAAARADARVNAASAEFRQTTGIDIEAYLANTASPTDQAKIMMKNVGAALKKSFNFVVGMFGRRPASDLQPDLSPQALTEKYEAARAAAAEAHARTIQPEADVKRIQDQIDKLTLSPEALRAKDDAAWDRAERAQNAYTLARGNRGRVSTFLPRESSPVTPELFVDDDEDVPEPSRSGKGYHPTALRMNHRAQQPANPLRQMPGIRKLAPLYAGPELSRTNGIKGAEAYDNVMDVPGFADRVNNLTDEDMDSFLAEAPAPISPEAAPWRETSSGGNEAPSFIETLETVASTVSRNRQEGLEIADRAYELLENDSDTENARRAHERFAIMGKYAKYLDQIVKTMVKDHGGISEQDVLQFARDTSANGSRMLSRFLTEALKKVGRERSIPSINEADDEQLAEITLLVRTLLQAKAEIVPALPAVSATSTYDRGTNEDDEPEVDFGAFEPIDLDDEDDR